MVQIITWVHCQESLDMVLDSDRCEIIEEILCPIFHTSHMIEVLRPTCISFSCYVSMRLWLLPDPSVTGGNGVCWVLCECSGEMIGDALVGSLSTLVYREGFSGHSESESYLWIHPLWTGVRLSRVPRNYVIGVGDTLSCFSLWRKPRTKGIMWQGCKCTSLTLVIVQGQVGVLEIDVSISSISARELYHLYIRFNNR